MSEVEFSIIDQGARPPEVNVEVHERPVESFDAAQTKKAVKTIESREAIRRQREEKLDLWMESVKEFIRSIDVKSL